MAVTDFLFQASTPPPAPTGSDVSSGGPLWLQTQLYNLNNAAGNLATQPYTPFPGPQVAAPSDATKQSWDMAQGNVGAWKPALAQAGALNASASSPITGNDINTFLNPYQSYVTGALNRNLTSNLLPAIQDRFVSAGQSRSPQERQMTNNAVYDTQQAAGQALAQNYGGALSALLQQRQQQLGAAGQLGTLATAGSQLGATDVGQIAAAGSAQDQNNQANLDVAKQNFQQQQQWPYQQLGFLSNITHGIPSESAGMTQQTVNSGYQPAASYGASPLSKFAGYAGLASQLGFRRGGRVPLRRGALSLSSLREAA